MDESSAFGWMLFGFVVVVGGGGGVVFFVCFVDGK